MAAPTPVSLGVPVAFGLIGTANGFTETTTTVLTGKFLLQSLDVSLGADEEQAKDSGGCLAARSFYNQHDKATLTYIVTGATVSAARTNGTLAAIGSIVNISACADAPDLVNSNWVVVGEPKITSSNTSAKSITLNLEAHPLVTAVMSAA